VERTDCDGVCEQVAGERKGSLRVFSNRVLERGEGRL